MSKVLSYLRSIGYVDDSNEQIIALGIRKIIDILTDFIFCIIIAGICRNIPAGIVFEVSGFILRIYAGGYHAPTPKICLCLTYTSILFGLLYIFWIPVSVWFSFGMAVFSYIIVIVFSPLESPNKPLYPEERAYYRKICIRITMIECILLLILLYLHIFLYVKVLSISVFLVALGLLSELLTRKKRVSHHQ